jgi:transposase
METIYRCVAGLDIHQKTVVVCVRRTAPRGAVDEDVRTFGTMTDDLLALADWLTRQQVEQAAMESTGVLWKPIWNILEAHGLTLLLVNAHDLTQVPGRKSDVKDSQWIAQLLACGLLHRSYVPKRPQRDLRDLTRLRAQLHGEHTRCANRLHKVLQDANIKLSSVATDVLGVSGREMLAALVAGENDPAALAELARGRLRGKIPELKRALRGQVTAHHQFLLNQLLDHLAHLEEQLAQFSGRIEECLRPFVDDDTLARLDAIPGVNRVTIENVVAEIGVDMRQFPTADHLASWAGVCPGNEESAGKRKRSRLTKGNVWLRRALAEAAWAARRKKDSYLAAQFRRLAGRRGTKRALMAVGHTILRVIYHLLKDAAASYQDLGGDYFDTLDPVRLRRYLVKRLESLGYEVQLRATTTTRVV